jgi:hypothetical protein
MKPIQELIWTKKKRPLKTAPVSDEVGVPLPGFLLVLLHHCTLDTSDQTHERVSTEQPSYVEVIRQ